MSVQIIVSLHFHYSEPNPSMYYKGPACGRLYAALFVFLHTRAALLLLSRRCKRCWVCRRGSGRSIRCFVLLGGKSADGKRRCWNWSSSQIRVWDMRETPVQAVFRNCPMWNTTGVPIKGSEEFKRTSYCNGLRITCHVLSDIFADPWTYSLRRFWNQFGFLDP